MQNVYSNLENIKKYLFNVDGLFLVSSFRIFIKNVSNFISSMNSQLKLLVLEAYFNS